MFVDSVVLMYKKMVWINPGVTYLETKWSSRWLESSDSEDGFHTGCGNIVQSPITVFFRTLVTQMIIFNQSASNKTALVLLLKTWPWNHNKVKSYKISFDAVIWADKVIRVAVNTCMKISSETWSNKIISLQKLSYSSCS